MDVKYLSSIKKYICDTIPLYEDKHNIIDNFFVMNNITRTINKNAKFVNLSLVSDDIIYELYKLLQRIISSKQNEFIDYDLKEKYKDTNNIEKIKYKQVTQKKNYKSLIIKDKLDKEIIQLSKNRKFESNI
jgi:hypothetical protein